MTTSAAKLLQAAAELVGGERELALRLGVDEALLWKMMTGTRRLPDHLLLRTVDIVLTQRDPLLSFPPTSEGLSTEDAKP